MICASDLKDIDSSMLTNKHRRLRNELELVEAELVARGIMTGAGWNKYHHVKAADRTVFISGHLTLSTYEFKQHYVPLINQAIVEGCSFIVGDAPGADKLAQDYLHEKGVASVVVFHMFDSPRHNAPGYPIKGGFKRDVDRDCAMTLASSFDIAWVRFGRSNSGTARNLTRRAQIEAEVETVEGAMSEGLPGNSLAQFYGRRE